MSWSNDIVLEFLELYRREHLLWDPKHPLHRNRNEVSEAWLRIQSSLSIHCSVTDLKKKKESLMTSFRMHLSKKRTLEGYRTNWFAYPLMESFLSIKYECDSTNQLENELYNNNGNYTTQSGVSENSFMINRNIIKSDKNTHRQIKTQNQKNPQTIKCSSDMIYGKKRMDESVSHMKNASDMLGDMDEYDLYGQLLAKKLRKLDEHQRDLTMHEIDNVMFRAKMQGISTQSSQRSNSTSPTTVPRMPKSPIFIVAQQNATNIQYEDENIPYPEQHPS